MSAKWQFNRWRPGDRARNSQVEKFFQSEEVADRTTAVVREGIQNSLDAASADSVNVRIAVGEISSDLMRPYSLELFAHLDGIRDHASDVPQPNDAVRFLAFEDFNTTGLAGDPKEWEQSEGHENPFFNFFRGEGVSDKSNEARGRHGVGKLVFSVDEFPSVTYRNRPFASAAGA